MKHVLSAMSNFPIKLIWLVVFLTLFHVLCAQDEKCGTLAPQPDDLSFWNSFDDARAYAIQKNGNLTPRTIPIRFTVFRRDDGTPANTNDLPITQTRIEDAISFLNDHYASANISFVQCGRTNYIDKTAIFIDDQYIQLSLFSYSSNAISVVVGNDSGPRGAATYLIAPSQDPLVLRPFETNRTNFISLLGYDELTVTLAHEVGHTLGLLHTFGEDQGSYYDNPTQPIENSPMVFSDRPYLEAGENIASRHRRELVIRNSDPSAFFSIPNHDVAGDLISDTPAWGRSNSTYPSPADSDCRIFPVNNCFTGIIWDYLTCEYIGDYVDYNNHPLENTDVSIRNFMSYTDHCRMDFTQGQYDKMIFINETIGVPFWWQQELCGNYVDYVEYRDTPIPLKNVTITIIHPEGNGKYSIATTDTEGEFEGVLFNDRVKTKVAWLGSGESGQEPPLSPGGPIQGYAVHNVNDYAIFEYTHEDWKAGITTADLIRIRKHILGTELLDGYDQLAADVSNSGTITTLDIIKIQSLLLGNRTEFEDIISGPWRFVPEYIPHQYTSDFHSDPFNMTIDGMSFSNEAPYVWATWEYNITNGTGGSAGFDAVKMGDVNGDGIAGMEDNCPDNVVVETSDVMPASTGETVDILVKADGFTNVVGFQLGFKFNTQKLKLVDLSVNTNLSGFAAGNVGLPKDNAVSDVLISWHDSQLSAKTLSNTELMLNVRVQAKENITDVSDYFYLDESTIEPAFYDIDGCTLPVEIEKSRANIQALNSANTGETTAPLALNTATNMETIPLPLEKTVTPPVLLSDLNCMPNPSLAGHWTVNANAIEMETQDGWLTIYDLNGAIVQQQKVTITGGINQWTIENTKLPTGIYLIELKTDAIQMRVKAVKG